jgi:hypothetical protein
MLPHFVKGGVTSELRDSKRLLSAQSGLWSFRPRSWHGPNRSTSEQLLATKPRLRGCIGSRCRGLSARPLSMKWWRLGPNGWTDTSINLPTGASLGYVKLSSSGFSIPPQC